MVYGFYLIILIATQIISMTCFEASDLVPNENEDKKVKKSLFNPPGIIGPNLDQLQNFAKHLKNEGWSSVVHFWTRSKVGSSVVQFWTKYDLGLEASKVNQLRLI